MDNSVMDDTPVSQVPSEAQAPSERMLPQSVVNELIGNAKREEREKAAARAVDEYKRQLQSEQQTSASLATNSLRGLSEDDVKRLASEELSRQKSEWEKHSAEKAQAEMADRIVATYRDKIASGRDKYEDFEAVTNNINMSRYPNVVQLLAEYVDNAPDILYNLAQRRGKLAEIEVLCERSPEDAVYEMKRLSSSIKANESAQQTRHSKAPLSQQRHSNAGTESGPLSIADFKKLYKG